MCITKAFFAILIAFSAFVLTACSDDAEAELSDLTKKLVEEKWVLQSSTINPPVNILGNLISDLYTLILPCDKDDFSMYKSNGKGTYDEGASKCQLSDPQTKPFTWSFLNNESQILQDGEVYDILDLSSERLEVEFDVDGKDYGMAGTFFRVKNVFTH